MPLIKGKSKKAFEHNIKAEMHAGKPQDQSLAIAYNIKKRNARKKMAEGGMAKDDQKTIGEIIGYPGSDKKKKMAHGGLITAKEEKRASADSEEKDPIHMHEQDSDFKHERRADADDASDSRDEEMLDSHSTMHSQEEDFKSERRTNIDDAGDDRDEQMLDGHPSRHEQELRAAGFMPDADESSEKPHSIAEAIMRRRKMAAGGMVDIDENGQESSANPNTYDDQNEEAALKELYDDEQLDPQPRDSNLHGDVLSDEDAHDMVESIRRKLRLKRMM